MFCPTFKLHVGMVEAPHGMAPSHTVPIRSIPWHGLCGGISKHAILMSQSIRKGVQIILMQA